MSIEIICTYLFCKKEFTKTRYLYDFTISYWHRQSMRMTLMQFKRRLELDRLSAPIPDDQTRRTPFMEKEREARCQHLPEA